MRTVRILLLFALGLGIAHASSFTGQVVTVRSAASPTTSGNTRISVQVAGTTSCSLNGWYSYDLPEASVGKVWTAILLAALTSGRSVAISGTGSCDPYGIEFVSYIDAK